MSALRIAGRRTAGLAGTIAALAAAAVIVPLAAAGAQPAQPTGQQFNLTMAQSCPASAQGILPLRSNSVGRAAQRALVSAAKDFGRLTTRGAKVMASDRSAFAGARGSEVLQLCGATVARRTVVVQMQFPRMLPSASLSEGVVFVGRFHGGYRVWFVAH